jgi:hypothetical protein
MDEKTARIMAGVDRLNGLLAWWGMAGSEGNLRFEGQIKRFQQFAADLQKAYGEAYRQQVEALSAANERLVRSLQGLLLSRKPDELMAAESEILATLLEGASLQAQTWAELGQRVQECCLALASEATAQVHKLAETPAVAPPQAERSATKQLSKEAAPV